MTAAQEAALRWLVNRGGTGVFDRGGVLLAAGERAGVRRSTWNALRDEGRINIDGRRVTAHSDAVAWCAANVSSLEATTVPDEGETA